MKRLIATLFAIVTLMMIAIVPMAAASADAEFDGLPNIPTTNLTNFELPQNNNSGVTNTLTGSVKYVGNLVRFFGVNLVETGISLVKDGHPVREHFPWSESALEDLHAAEKQVKDNAGKALEEIKELPGKVWNGITDIAGSAKDGACWVWNKVTSIF